MVNNNKLDKQTSRDHSPFLLYLPFLFNRWQPWQSFWFFSNHQMAEHRQIFFSCVDVVCEKVRNSVADPRRGEGFKPRLWKKSSPYLGVSLWFGDILSEKQCPICLRLHEKTFGNRTLYSKIFFLSNFNSPLTGKLDASLQLARLWRMSSIVQMLYKYCVFGPRPPGRPRLQYIFDVSYIFLCWIQIRWVPA